MMSIFWSKPCIFHLGKVLSMSSKAFHKLSFALSKPVSWVLSLPPPPIGSTLISSLLLK